MMQFLLAALLAVASPASDTKSVLLIVADDVGYTEWAEMPNLQAAAAQGTRFVRAYAWPMCSPSRYAFMYGRYGRRIGMGGNQTNPHDLAGMRLAAREHTLAELLGQRRATLLVGKDHLGRGQWSGELDEVSSGPPSRGFDCWRAVCPVTPAFSGSAGYRDWWRSDDDGALVREVVYATNAQRDEFVAWWTSTAGPKFGVLSWSAAHDPFDAPPGTPLKASTRAQFVDVVRYMDAQLPAVLAAVDLAETFVFWMGDNGTPNPARLPGTPFGEWKFTTFDGGIRVPLVAIGPGIGQGVSERLVSLVDIPATVAELACQPISAGFEDSMSFANELGAWTGTPERAFAFSERYSSTYDDQAVIESDTVWPGTSITVRMKLRRVDLDGPGPAQGQDLVYDLLADQYEQNPEPLSSPIIPPSVRNRLLAELASLPPRSP